LTFVSKTPERPGLLRHHPFETLADWMIAKMLPDHIEHFAPWLVATPPDVSTARTENSRRTGTLQIADVQPDHLPALNEVNRLGNSVRYEPQAGPMIGGQDNHRQPPTGEILLIADILVASEQNVEPACSAASSNSPFASPCHATSSAALSDVLADSELTGRAYWRRTRSSRNGRWLLKGTPCEAKDLVDLLPADRREPLQEFTDGGALVKMLKERCHKKARTAETPGPA
jgi:hypothetical protein